MTTFAIRRGDTLPYLKVAVREQTDIDTYSAYDLTNCTVEFHMTKRRGDTPEISASANITSASDGYVEYRWADGDTDNAGIYFAEFQITTLSGATFTLPVDDSLMVEVINDISD